MAEVERQLPLRLAFTAAGDARYFQNAPGDAAGPMQVATIRLMNGGGDSIFADGFDG